MRFWIILTALLAVQVRIDLVVKKTSFFGTQDRNYGWLFEWLFFFGAFTILYYWV